MSYTPSCWLSMVALHVSVVCVSFVAAKAPSQDESSSFLRQTLVLQLECVVENTCELHTVLLAEYVGLA